MLCVCIYIYIYKHTYIHTYMLNNDSDCLKTMLQEPAARGAKERLGPRAGRARRQGPGAAQGDPLGYKITPMYQCMSDVYY